MSAPSLLPPAPAAPAARAALLARAGRLIALVAAVLALTAAIAPAAGWADSAPEQWQPTGGDVVRTIRHCPMQVEAPSQPICWSMTEDTTAWVAQPPGSPYPWGQCTYYVGVMRPDIWNDRAPPSLDPLNDWDAWTWTEHAQAEGLSVDGTPQPGDVMVYSRAALGNATGHVAIVESVDGTDASTGDLILTVSEMNVEGLDAAAQGQGDTSTVLVPRSQLVPGMIQFIHRPGPGYTPPAWPSGWSAQGGQTSVPATRDPSLTVAVSADAVAVISQSPAPIQATVTAAATGAPVQQLTVRANRATTLKLPTGTYRVCVAQVATGAWSAAGACATGTWRGPLRATMTVGSPRRSGHRISFAVVVGAPPAAVAVAAGATFPASAQVTVRSSRRIGRRVITRWIVERATLRLHVGRQLVRLNLGRSPAVRAGAAITVRIGTTRGAGAAVVAAAHAAATLR